MEVSWQVFGREDHVTVEAEAVLMRIVHEREQRAKAGAGSASPTSPASPGSPASGGSGRGGTITYDGDGGGGGGGGGGGLERRRLTFEGVAMEKGEGEGEGTVRGGRGWGKARLSAAAISSGVGLTAPGIGESGGGSEIEWYTNERYTNGKQCHQPELSAGGESKVRNWCARYSTGRQSEAMAKAKAEAEVGTDKRCSPRHLTHFKLLFLDSDGIV